MRKRECSRNLRLSKKRLVVYKRISEMSLFPLWSKATPQSYPVSLTNLMSQIKPPLVVTRGPGRWWCLQIESIWCILQRWPSVALVKATLILEAEDFWRDKQLRGKRNSLCAKPWAKHFAYRVRVWMWGALSSAFLKTCFLFLSSQPLSPFQKTVNELVLCSWHGL